ncbi:MAG: hypothetical protein AB7S26_22080 [Sandaracinaceae bacterium]
MFALGALTSRGLTHGDAALTLATAEALVEHGNGVLTLDPGATWIAPRRVAGGLVFDDGTGLRSAAPPLAAWIAVPGTALAHLVGVRGSLDDRVSPLFGSNADARTVLRSVQDDLRVVFFALLIPIGAGLAAGFLDATARVDGVGRAARRAMTLLAFLGSPALAYAGSDWPQPLAMAALAAALLGAVMHARGRPRGAWTVGVALALAWLLRYELILLAPWFVIAMVRSDRAARRSVTRALARALVPISVAAIVHAVVGWPAAGEGASLTTWSVGLVHLSVSPTDGLLVFAPFALAAPFGVRREPLAWILVGVPLSAWILYAAWFDHTASLAYGPRFLVPVLPILALAAVRTLDRGGPFRRVAIATSGIVGAAVCAPGALLAHARLESALASASATPIDAWSMLLRAHGAAGALGIDCASTYVPCYAWAALIASALGAALVSR